MDRNPPLKTIEGDLFDALVKAGAISKDNSNDPKKVSLSHILVVFEFVLTIHIGRLDS